MVPIIDRDFLPHRPMKLRFYSSHDLVIATAITAFLLVSAIEGLVVQVGNDGDLRPSETPTRNPAGMLYAAHSPISIVGNGGFTNASGVVWGSGTESDPYVIGGWDIDASTANGIDVRSTDVHFAIVACSIQGGLNSHWGIVLSNCANGTMSSNTCSDNVVGIYAELSGRNNTVSNNMCSHNQLGMWLSGSGNYILKNNNCSNNTQGGIDISSSNGSSISDNICSNNGGYGMVIKSDGDTVNNNTCSSDISQWIGIQVSSFGNNTIVNNTCSGSEYGISIGTSNGNLISNNTCTNGGTGIVLNGYLGRTSGNTVRNNTCIDNIYGISLVWASNNTLLDNNCSLSQNYGISVETYSNNTTISRNTLISNSLAGIYLGVWNNNNTLSNNTCLRNLNGVFLARSGDNNVIRNQICYNYEYGVFISTGSNDNNLWNNTFCHNNGTGDIYDPTHVQAFDSGVGNRWNTTNGYGNYWCDWQTPDGNWDGRVDLPYNITGTAGAKDYYPLTTASTPIPEFGIMPLMAIALMAAIVLAGETRRRKKS